MAIALVGILSVHFASMNRKVAKGQAVIEGLPGFRYTL